MSARILPQTLNDGRHDYVILSQEQQLPDGRKIVALYERVPTDPGHQFTPDLAFCEGHTKVPVMHAIVR